MKLLLRIVLYLYPRHWRRRYEQEFRALLDQTPITPGAILDIARSALVLQLVQPPAILTCAALTGLALSFLAPYCLPPVYVSQAEVAFEIPASELEPALNLLGHALSRDTLNDIIDRYDPFPDLSSRLPREDIIVTLARQLRISGAIQSNAGQPAFQITFSAANPKTAQQVTSAIAEAMLTAAAKHPGLSTQLRTPASFPRSPVRRPSNLQLFIGFSGGLAVGILSLWYSRRTSHAA